MLVYFLVACQTRNITIFHLEVRWWRRNMGIRQARCGFLSFARPAKRRSKILCGCSRISSWDFQRGQRRPSSLKTGRHTCHGGHNSEYKKVWDYIGGKTSCDCFGGEPGPVGDISGLAGEFKEVAGGQLAVEAAWAAPDE